MGSWRRDATNQRPRPLAEPGPAAPGGAGARYRPVRARRRRDVPARPFERKLLADTLDEGWEFRDARRVEDAAAVLLRPCSTQTVAAVRRRFPDARIIVVEPPVLDGSYVASPVERALEVGADVYLAEATSWAA